jgi:putative membrane protein
MPGPPAHRPLPALALNFVRGLLMGAADTVPGISGGTVALVVGIYERLVRSLRAFTGAPLALARGDAVRAGERLRAVEWALVVPLVAGILAAIVVGAGVIPGLLEDHPTRMSALFFGLILGSLVVPWRMIGGLGAPEAALVAAAAVVAFVLVGLPEREIAEPSFTLVFAAAAVAICAMVLPGVSGAYLLLLIGIYRPTLEAVHERDLAYVAVFAAGAATGLVLFARILGWLLDRYRRYTLAALLGLMAGSLRALWPWADDERALPAPPPDAGEAFPALLFALVGLGLVTGIVALATRAARAREAGRPIV